MGRQNGDRAAVGHERPAGGRIGPADLLDHLDEGRDVRPGPAELLRQAQAVESGIGDRLEQVVRHVAQAVGLGNRRLDPLPERACCGHRRVAILQRRNIHVPLAFLDPG